MKKLLIGIFIFAFCNMAIADNSERITELQAQGQKIVQEIQQAQAFLQNKQSEFLKIQGAIEELSRVVEQKPENESKG
jgi:hypothetical protein